MAIGTLQTEADLENFVQSRLDKLAISQSTQTLKSIAGHEHAGTGSPEGVVEAPVGDRYRREDGGAGTSLYVKESGAGNTGWVGK